MKKEALSIMTVKILLAVIIFAGVGTIIVGGGYIIGEYSKICDNHPFSSEKSFLSKKVILKTDKVEYSTGESIELTVENNSEETVFLAEKPSGFSYPEPILEKYEDGAWAGYEWHSYYLFSEYHILRFICHKIQDETKIGLLIQNKYTGMLLPEGKYRVALTFGKSCNGQNSAGDTNNGLIDSFVIYSNEFEIRKSQKDNNLTMDIITDKKEYQKDEKVKLTISNLNKETVFSKISLEMNNGERVNLDKFGFDKAWIPVFDDLIKGIRCGCNDVCDKMPSSIEANSNEEYVWDQRIGLCDEKLPIDKKLRFRIISWDRYGRVKKYYYSDEFIIKEKVKEKMTEVDASDWQTYRNEEFGFKYPKEWKIKTKEFQLEKTITITAHDNSKKYSLEKWLKTYKETSPIEADLIWKKEISLDGERALKGGFGCCTTYLQTVFFAREDKIYEISGGEINFNKGRPYYDYGETFEQILSSFKFTQK